jgi:hypothetical protein
MVLINGLGVVDATEHGRDIILCNTNQGLDDQQSVGDEAENGVRGRKVGAVVIEFVVFNNDETRNEGEEGGAIQSRVDVGPELLLVSGVGGLKDQNGLRAEEETGGVEELGWGLTVRKRSGRS